MTAGELIIELIRICPMDTPVDVEISQGERLVAIRPLARQMELVEGRLRLWTTLEEDSEGE